MISELKPNSNWRIMKSTPVHVFHSQEAPLPIKNKFIIMHQVHDEREQTRPPVMSRHNKIKIIPNHESATNYQEILIKMKS